MNKTVLIAIIGLVTTLLVSPVIAGSITIVRSGASVDEFVDGDNHSLEDSIYEHGIQLGNGFGKATPVYHILLPHPTYGGNQITSITVTIEGNNSWLSWPNAYIGTPAQGPYSLRDDGLHTYVFTGSDARDILDAVGDGLAFTLDVKIDVGGITDQYDLKEITVTYEYSNVSSDILERFQQAYASYRTLKEYESGIVNSLWNTGAWSSEHFYQAVQESLAFADNLSGLSGDLYGSLKSTIDCIENFQSLTGILESAFDYAVFWISYSYTAPDKSDVSNDLIDARDSFQGYAQHLLDYAFDGDISSSDATQLNSDIDTAKTDTTDLRQTMYDVQYECHRLYHNETGPITAEIMLNSLFPLLNFTYDLNNYYNNPNYLTGLIDKLIHFSPPSDTTPPTPNPMTWQTEPYETSTSSISMTATVATDSSTPVYYEFDFYNSPTGGTGGDDRSWNTSQTYTDSSLQTNHQYGYRVRAKDSAPAQNTTGYSSPISYEYTDIETPSGSTFGTITSTSIQVKSSNTPSGLTRGSSGLYIDSSYGTNSGWKQNNDVWTCSNLTPNYDCSFHIKARNGDGDETGYYASIWKYTLANQPSFLSFSNIETDSIQINWSSNGNYYDTDYYCDNLSTGYNSSWINNIYSWNCSSLTPNTQYEFGIKARNNEDIETNYTYTPYCYTLANEPGEIFFSDVSSNFIQINWDVNENPAGTYFYCENVTNNSNSEWRSLAYWKIFSLLPNTNYGFRVKAKNNSGIETDYSSTEYKYTLANVPERDSFSHRTPNSIQVNWLSNGNPPDTEYYCENVTNDANSGWITDTSWICEGLTGGIAYSFQVKAKNEEGIETESINLGCTYGGGAGEPNDPYLIYTPEQMNAIGANPADWDNYFLLIGDIDLSNYTGTQFNIIGTSSNPFVGVFDGNGFTISNFTYTATDTNDIGLFGCIGYFANVTGGRIRDVGLVSVNIDADNGNNIGGLVGSAIGTISGCYVKGVVKGNNNVGGLVGFSYSGCGYKKILLPNLEGGMRPGFHPLYGFFFWESIISDCYTTTSVDANCCIGGLVGYSSYTEISNCYASGTVDGIEYEGGLVGYDGIAGYDFNSIYTKCFWSSDANPDSNGIGNRFDPNVIGKTTTELQVQETFIDAGWDFVSDPNQPSDIWTMPDEEGCPILWWQKFELPELPSFSGGSGTPNDPYLITTAEELNRIGHNPRLMDACFKVIDDIDLANIEFFIIGTKGYPFSGVFDGNDFTISNLRLVSCGTNNVGLFGCTRNYSHIKGISLRNLTVEAETGLNVGGLVGLADNSVISNCYVSGNVSGEYFVGLLVGSGEFLKIMNCCIDGEVLGTGHIGGLIGYSSNCNLSGCYATVDINGDYGTVGGVVGDSLESTLSNCYVTGDIIGSEYVGGLVGYSLFSSTSHCYSAAMVDGTSTAVGGLVGYSPYNGYPLSDYSKCFWDNSINPSLNGIGWADDPNVVAKTTAEMQTESTFIDASWDFIGEDTNGSDDIWRMCVDGVEYPKLWWEFSISDFACGDGVDFIDFAVLADTWNFSLGETGYNDKCDLAGDDIIDFADLAIFTDHWLEGVE